MGISVFMEPMMQSLHIGRSQMSFAYLLGTLASGFALPFAGRWLDQLGIRKVIVWVTLLFGIVMLGMGQLGQLYALLIVDIGLPATGFLVIMVLMFFMMRFLGQGLLVMCSGNMRAKWFNQRRGVVMAGAGVFINFGFSLSPLLLGTLVDELGWAFGWFLLAAVMLLFCLPVFWYYCRDNPEECGLVMDGRVMPTGKQTNTDLIIYREYSRDEALRTYSFWVLTGVVAWQGLFMTGYIFHMEDVAVSVGITKDDIRVLFAPASLVSALVSIGCGFLVDRTRLKYFGVVMGLGSAVGAFAMPYLASEAGVLLYVLGAGTAGGCFGLILSNTYPRFYGRQHLGAISGAATSILVFASAVGPFFFSEFRRIAGDYDSVFFIGGVIPLIVGMMAFWADNPQRIIAKRGPVANK